MRMTGPRKVKNLLSRFVFRRRKADVLCAPEASRPTEDTTAELALPKSPPVVETVTSDLSVKDSTSSVKSERSAKSSSSVKSEHSAKSSSVKSERSAKSSSSVKNTSDVMNGSNSTPKVDQHFGQTESVSCSVGVDSMSLKDCGNVPNTELPKEPKVPRNPVVLQRWNLAKADDPQSQKQSQLPPRPGCKEAGIELNSDGRAMPQNDSYNDTMLFWRRKADGHKGASEVDESLNGGDHAKSAFEDLKSFWREQSDVKKPKGRSKPIPRKTSAKPEHPAIQPSQSASSVSSLFQRIFSSKSKDSGETSAKPHAETETSTNDVATASCDDNFAHEVTHRDKQGVELNDTKPMNGTFLSDAEINIGQTDANNGIRNKPNDEKAITESTLTSKHAETLALILARADLVGKSQETFTELVRLMSNKDGLERGFEVLLEDFKEFLSCQVSVTKEEMIELNDFLSCATVGYDSMKTPEKNGLIAPDSNVNESTDQVHNTSDVLDMGNSEQQPYALTKNDSTLSKQNGNRDVASAPEGTLTKSESIVSETIEKTSENGSPVMIDIQQSQDAEVLQATPSHLSRDGSAKDPDTKDSSRQEIDTTTSMNVPQVTTVVSLGKDGRDDYSISSRSMKSSLSIRGILKSFSRSSRKSDNDKIACTLSLDESPISTHERGLIDKDTTATQEDDCRDDMDAPEANESVADSVGNIEDHLGKHQKEEAEITMVSSKLSKSCTGDAKDVILKLVMSKETEAQTHIAAE